MRVRLPARFLPRLVPVALVVALLAGLLPTLGVTARPQLAAAAPAAQATDCVVGTELVTNGSFESPGVFSDGLEFDYTPDGWTGDVAADRSVPGDFIDQNVYINFLLGGLTQTLDTTGLGGAQLTVAYNTKSVYGADELPLIQIGDQELSFTTGGFRLSQTVTLPENIGPSTTLILGGVNYGGPGNKAIDAVSVVVSSCPSVPLTFDPLNQRLTEKNSGLSAAVVLIRGPFAGGEAIQYQTANGTAFAGADYVATSGTVTCGVSMGCPTLTFTVSVIADTTVEPDETFLVRVYRASTPNDVVSSTITIINDDVATPVARDQSVTTAQNTAIPITLDASNPGGYPIDFGTVTVGPSHGNISVRDTVVTYTPELNYTGSDSFRYTVRSNGQTSNEATVSITVTAVNDPPVAVADTYSMAEDTTLSVTTRATGVLGNDTDADPGQTATLDAAVVAFAVHGDLILQADGTFTYTPDANFSGTDTFTYIAGDGVAESNVATVTITVAPVNDPLTLTPSSFTITLPQDTSETVFFTPTDADGLDYDLAPPGSGEWAPANGSLSYRNAVGNPGTENEFNDSITYTPNPGFAGTDSFVVAYTDGTSIATVSVNVTVTDTAAPVFTGTPPNVTAAATDATGAIVTYALPAATDNGGTPTVRCVPASGSRFALGTTTVTCTATDGATNTATSRFTVTVTDQGAPVFTSLPNVTVGATSNYGAVVAYTLPTATDNTTTPTVSCVPAPGSQFPIGTTTVICTASDGVNVTTGSFTVTVTNNGFRDPRDPRPGASPQTQPPTTPTPRPARPPRG